MGGVLAIPMLTVVLDESNVKRQIVSLLKAEREGKQNEECWKKQSAPLCLCSPPNRPEAVSQPLLMDTHDICDACE